MALLFACALAVGIAQIAGAADDPNTESITLSPTSKRYALDAGQVVQDNITVINDGKLAYDFLVYSRPYSVKDESYDPNFTDTPSNADAYQWVQFEKTSWRLEPGQRVEIPYTMRVPSGAAPGGHYGVLFAETQPSKEETQSGSVIRKKRVGTILYATVKGTFRSGGEFLGVTIPGYQSRSPLEGSATIKNTGNSDFDLTSKFRVTDVFGNLKFEINKISPVLPQSTRKVKYEWPDVSWFGIYKVSVESSYLDKKADRTESYVFVAPRWLLVVLVAALVGGGAYAFLRKRR